MPTYDSNLKAAIAQIEQAQSSKRKTAVYLLNDWKDSTPEDILCNFDREGCASLTESQALRGAEILLASYTYEDYEGNAFVLFRRDGKLWEVNGWHCSCYELQGQWDPEETTASALLHRVKKGNLGGKKNPFADELMQVLDELKES
jgi:hypothetical protein